MKANTSSPQTCSTREAAQVLGISVRTAQLWVEEGRLQAWKTPGGHRRILRTSVDQLCQQQQASARQAANELSIHLLSPQSERGKNLQALLESNFPGCTLRTSSDVFDALLVIGDQKPNVLISDIDAIGQYDYRMLAAIDRNPRLAGMLVVMLSGRQAARTALQAKVAGDITVFDWQDDHEQLLRLVKAYNRGRQHLNRVD